GTERRTRRPVAVAAVRELLMRQCPDGYARSCDALADAQPTDVSSIEIPVLLVTGDEDAIAPAQAVRQIGEKIRGARGAVAPRCGDWSRVEKPEECDGLLRRFYAQRM